ncbi:MAG TPA: hypothetical protein DDW52_11820 [Planctomycetaceae bacterium]|nr:hypothetical protein [Planctomycetaceae bacterium]
MRRAVDVAETFLRFALEEGESLNQMHLQRLVYISHGWSLALLGQPLICDEIVARQFGPFIGGIHGRYRRYGGGPIADQGKLHPFDEVTALLLNRVWAACKNKTLEALSSLTISQGTPWERVRGPLPVTIQDDEIREYFAQLVEADNATQLEHQDAR